MNLSARLRDPWTWVLACGFALVIVLLVVPLFAVFRHSLIDPETGSFSLVHYQHVLTQPTYRTAVWHSLVVSIGGTLGALLLGVPLALLTTRYRIAGKNLLHTLAVLSLLSPPFIGAYSWILMLGRAGYLRAGASWLGLDLPTIYGPGGIVLVYSLQYYPFVLLLTTGALSTVDRSLEEAAEGLGVTGWRLLRKVTLPLVLPSLSAGALIAFMMAVANFGTPMIIGGNYTVLPTLAYDRFTSEVGQDPGLAAALCVLLIVCSCGALVLQRWAATRRKTASVLLRRPLVRRLRGWKNVVAHAVCYGIVGFSTLPLANVVVFSFRNTSGPVFQPGFGFDSYRQVVYSVPRAITNSLVFASAAVSLIAICGALLGYLVARRRSAASKTLDGLLMIPYVVPGIVLGIGFLVAFNGPPLVLSGTAAILVLAYFVRRLPYAVRSSAAILDQLDPALEEAAQSVGAPPGRTFLEVTLPLMLPGVFSGAVLAWVTAVNELSASIVLYVGKTVTMPVIIYQQVLDGSFGPASALATILLASTGVALFVVLKVIGAERESLV
jgi:iron(III) transport system permease protein